MLSHGEDDDNGRDKNLTAKPFCTLDLLRNYILRAEKYGLQRVF